MASTNTLFELIRRIGTVSEFAAFLREHHVRASGTWDDLEARARQALSKGSLSEADLLAFLRDAEEYGYQHVFLYRSVRPGPLPDRAKLEAWLRELGASPDVLDTPLLVDLPESPTVADVRIDATPTGRALVIKAIEKREYVELLATHEQGGGRFTREYQRREVRAVNVVRMFEDGFIEMRVYRHSNSSRDYSAERGAFWSTVAGLTNAAHLEEMPLVVAKNSLYAKRHEIESVVSFSGTSIQSACGNVFTASCSRNRSLFDDQATDDGLARIIEGGHGYHDSLNVWWLKQPTGLPSRDIHVLLRGDSNELAFPQQCSKADYEHVLADIRRYNS